MNIIQSKDNSKIKYVKSLFTKKNRDKERAFTVEGLKFVVEAINEGAHIKFVLINENLKDKTELISLINVMENSNIEYYLCSDNVFKYTNDTINSQGVLAVVNKRQYDISQIMSSYNFLILCDRIQDPGNLGTIIRTADAFGPAAVILNTGCVDLYNPKVVRATAGAMFRVSVAETDNDIEFMNILKNQGFQIISTVVESNLSFDDMEDYSKICIVIGNEGQGISQEIEQNSHICITIKMSGRAESLNASVAAGICIYEIRKKLL